MVLLLSGRVVWFWLETMLLRKRRDPWRFSAAMVIIGGSCIARCPLSPRVLVFGGYMLIVTFWLKESYWQGVELTGAGVDVGTVILVCSPRSHTYVGAIDRVCFADSTA